MALSGESVSMDTVNNELVESDRLCRLFVGGLNVTTTADTVRRYFSKWGTVRNVDMKWDTNTQKSRGFAFLTYQTPDEVDSAQLARPHHIEGKKLKTTRAVPKKMFGKPEMHMLVRSVFVKDIPDHFTMEEVLEYFKAFGQVISIRFDTSKKNGKKYAVVEYKDSDPVDKAYFQNLHIMKGCRLNVLKHFSKEQQAYLKQLKDNFGPYAWKDPNNRRRNIFEESAEACDDYNFIGEGGGYSTEMEPDSYPPYFPNPTQSYTNNNNKKKSPPAAAQPTGIDNTMFGGGPVKRKTAGIRNEPYVNKSPGGNMGMRYGSYSTYDMSFMNNPSVYQPSTAPTNKGMNKNPYTTDERFTFKRYFM